MADTFQMRIEDMPNQLDSLVITIEFLFILFKTYGYYVRINEKRGDLIWSPIKALLLKIDSLTKVFKWNTLCKKFYSYMKQDLKLYGDTIVDPITKVEMNDNPNHAIWQPHHFALQHGRIPELNKESLMRLCQIGFNNGQMNANIEMSAKSYSSDQLDYILDEKNALTDVYTYISREDALLMNLLMKECNIRDVLIEVIKYIVSDVSIKSKY